MRHRAFFGSVAIALIALVAAACGSNGTTTSGGKKHVKHSLAVDTQEITAVVQDVQVAIGEAIKNPTAANVDSLAQAAQQAHDTLKNAKDQIALDGPTSNVGGQLYGAVDELKNAMGAIVAYTGNPNPATLAHLTSQYRAAISDWDAAVEALYKGTADVPPTISP